VSRADGRGKRERRHGGKVASGEYSAAVPRLDREGTMITTSAARIALSPLATLALGLGLAASCGAQQVDRVSLDSADHHKAPRVTHFFDSEEPLAVTLTTNIGRLRKDKSDKAPWRAATLSYAGPDGAPVTVPLSVHTRGIWRLRECDFPPLRLDFDKPARGTQFEGLGKPKLVNYCRDDDVYEQYVLQELQLYRVHALLTPASHKVRLVRMTYADSGSGKTRASRYAFIIEAPSGMAARFGGEVLEQKGANASDFDSYSAALVGVFQYMIGNADWSASQLHNAEILRDSVMNVMLVPYDFDFAGAVNTTYATPDPRFNLQSVRDRVYRGHCATPDDFARVFALFQAKKDAIYALYSDQIGRLIKPHIAKETLRYFDQFYDTIGSPRTAKRAIVEECSTRQ
jgi:hypothetical protein